MANVKNGANYAGPRYQLQNRRQLLKPPPQKKPNLRLTNPFHIRREHWPDIHASGDRGGHQKSR